MVICQFEMQNNVQGHRNAKVCKQTFHGQLYVYGRFHLVKLGVQLRPVELQYNLVLFKSRRQALF